MDVITKFLKIDFLNLPFSFNPSGYGWLLGLFVMVVLVIYGLSLGKTKVILSLLSVYIALAFDRLFPYMDQLVNLLGKRFEPYLIKVSLFLVVYIIIFYALNFSFLKSRLSKKEFSLLSIVLISALQFGLFVSIATSIIPENIISGWLFGFYSYFAGPKALFLWAMAPLPALLFLKES